ncbi:MAG: hypothetical protein ACPGN3_12795 [Opitutales bacterium]
MKPLKFVLIGFAICLVLILCGIGSLFLAPVQKSLFLTYANNSGELRELSLDAIEIDLEGIEFENLSFETDAGKFSFEFLSVDAPLLEFVNSPSAEITDFEFDGVVLDFSEQFSEEVSVPEENVEADPTPIVLPSLAEIDIFEQLNIKQGSGDVTVVLSDAESMRLDYTVRDLAPGKEGRIAINWAWTQPGFVAHLGDDRQVGGSLAFGARLDPNGVLIALNSIAELGLTLDGQVSNSARLISSLKDSDDGFLLDSRLVYMANDEENSDLLAGSLEFPRNLGKFTYRGTLALDSELLSPILQLLQIAVPSFQVNSDIAVEFNKGNGAVIAESRGSARYGDLSNQYDLVLNGQSGDAFQGRVTGYLASNAGESGSRLELSEIDAMIEKDSSVRAVANVIFAHAGKQERLKLSAMIPGDAQKPLGFDINSDTLSVPHLQTVADALVASLPETSNSESPSGEPGNPFDVGRPVQLSGKVGRLVIEEPWSLDTVELNTRIENGALDLRKMDFNFLSGRFSNAGVIGFKEGKFGLDAKSNLRGLTVGSAMTTLGFNPIVDTTLGGDVQWTAQAESMSGLIGNMRLGWNFRAEEGSINIPESDIMRSLRGATQAASIIGTFLPGQNYLGNFSKIVDKADVVKLDQINFSGERSQEGALKIEQLELKGTEFYAQLAGDIRSTNWSDILEAAARFQLNVGSKGEVSELADQIGLSEGRVRDGYQLWGKMPFSITGTLEQLNFGTMQEWALGKVIGSPKKALTRKNTEDPDPQKPAVESATEQIKREAERVLGGLLNSVLGE